MKIELGNVTPNAQHASSSSSATLSPSGDHFFDAHDTWESSEPLPSAAAPAGLQQQIPAFAGDRPLLLVQDETEAPLLNEHDPVLYQSPFYLEARLDLERWQNGEIEEAENPKSVETVVHRLACALAAESQRPQSYYTLSLAALSLKSLPKQIGRLQRVTKLILAHNKLLVLPSSIGAMHSLRDLDVGCNVLDQFAC